MDCKPKWSSWLILVVNSLIVAATMLFVHFIWYGVKDTSAYSRSWQEIGITVLFAVAYAYLFNKVSHHWRPNYAYGFVNRKAVVSVECGLSLTNFINAMIFAIIIMVIIFSAMMLAGVFMSTFYVFVLDGIRGAVPDPDPVAAGAVAAQIGGATLAIEFFGKTEGTPRRPM